MTPDVPAAEGTPEEEGGTRPIDHPLSSRERVRRRLWWFAEEIFVVVCGVLLALAVQSWYEGRREVAREREYLRQLYADLLETERVFSEIDSLNAPLEHATSMLVQTFYAAEPAPADSIIHWIDRAPRFRRARVVFGTARALIATGDLNLIRSDSMRSAIISYLDYIDDRLSNQEQWIGEYLIAMNDLRRIDGYADVFPLYRLAPTTNPAVAEYPAHLSPPAGGRRALPEVDVVEFVRRAEVRSAYARMSEMKQSLWLNRREMKTATADLKTVVEAYLHASTRSGE